MNTANIEIATVGTGGSGSLQVSGSASVVDQNVSGASLTVGSAAGNLGSITASLGGTFVTGNVLTTVNATGTINVGLAGEGIFTVRGNMDIVGGALHVGGDAGDVFSLGSGQTLTASSGGMVDFDGAYQIAGAFDIQDATFDADGPLSLASTGTLTIDGGEVNAHAGFDTSAGTLDFRSGTLTVTGGNFLPNLNGLSATDFYTIETVPGAVGIPHLVIGSGSIANIGWDFA